MNVTMKNTIQKAVETYEKEVPEIERVKEINNKLIAVERQIISILKHNKATKLFYELEDLEIEKEILVNEFYYEKGLKDGIKSLLDY